MYTDIKLEISFLRFYNILHRQMSIESPDLLFKWKKKPNFYSAVEIHLSNLLEQFKCFTRIYMYSYTDDLHVLFF